MQDWQAPYIVDVFEIDKKFTCSTFNKATYADPDRKLIKGNSVDLFTFPWYGLKKAFKSGNSWFADGSGVDMTPAFPMV